MRNGRTDAWFAQSAGLGIKRAGEQGRGFAVVAAEVRNVAQRSSQAARGIKALARTARYFEGTSDGRRAGMSNSPAVPTTLQAPRAGMS